MINWQPLVFSAVPIWSERRAIAETYLQSADNGKLEEWWVRTDLFQARRAGGVPFAVERTVGHQVRSVSFVGVIRSLSLFLFISLSLSLSLSLALSRSLSLALSLSLSSSLCNTDRHWDGEEKRRKASLCLVKLCEPRHLNRKKLNKTWMLAALD
jgi:hypothetical protein